MGRREELAEEAFERTEEGRGVVAGLVGFSAESTGSVVVGGIVVSASSGGTETRTNHVHTTD